MTDAIIVYCTTSSMDEAKHIAEALVNEKLSACVSIIPNVTSVYRWEGKLCTDYEITLMIKSRQPKLDQIINKIKELHSYQVPEIIAAPILGGSTEYLEWLLTETSD